MWVDCKIVVSNLNAGQALPKDALSPRMQGALDLMAGLAISFTGGDESSQIDRDILPYRVAANRPSGASKTFEVTKISSIAHEVRAFAEGTTTPNMNPVDAYKIQAYAGKDMPVVCLLYIS